MRWCRRPWWSRAFVLAAVGLAACSSDDTLGALRSQTTVPPSPPSVHADGSTPGATEPTTPQPSTPETSAPNASAPDGGTAAGSVPSGDDVVVGAIVDGDTFRTKDGERVRLLNIDTPEPTQHECWSSEATRRLHELVPPGTPVRLAYDVDRYDRYGRTLAHVYRLDDALWVNVQLALDGAARAYVLEPNDTHYAEIRAAAEDAARNGRGLWGACGEQAAPPGPGARSPGANGGPAAGSSGDGCDPAYPTVCIPPPPPDLDCGDITARRFPVLPPDPHRFDGGGDGIGCERG